MQIRWRNIWLLSLWTTAIISAALAASVIFHPRQSKQASVVYTAKDRTLYVEIPHVGFADPGPGIYTRPKASERDLSELPVLSKEEAAIREAAQQAAKDADAAGKH